MRFLLWPFEAIFKLASGIIKTTGRLTAIILGIVFMIAGVAVSLTIVGAIIGIPLALFGFMLMVKGFF